MKGKRLIWILLLAVVAMTACQKQGDGEAARAENSIIETGKAELETNQAVEADKGKPSSPDYTPAIAEGYQFVKGLGICSPGNPVVYQVSGTAGDSKAEEITNEYASARLIDAIYQDKMLVITLVLEDTSISVVPDEEAEPLLEKDNSYFCIDMEEQIYGHSGFLGELNRSNPTGANRLVDARLYPPGIKESGYGFQSQSLRTNYKEYEDGWHCVVTAELQLSRVPFTVGELEEEFKLELNGFEDPLLFRLKAAEEVMTLEELPGLTVTEGISFLACGKVDQQELTISLYPVQEDGYQVYPVTTGVACRMDGADSADGEKTYQMYTDGNSRQLAGLFAGLSPSGIRQFTCLLPDEVGTQDMKLILNQLTIATEEKSGIYPIPIPENVADIDMKVDFQDGTLYLTKVERMQEEISLGHDENGKDILKPGIFLMAQAEAKNEGIHMGIVLGYEADYLDKEGEINRFGRGPVFPDVTDQPFHECEVTGYRIPYEPGAKEVDVIFWNPEYLLDRQVVLPVRFDG